MPSNDNEVSKELVTRKENGEIITPPPRRTPGASVPLSKAEQAILDQAAKAAQKGTHVDERVLHQVKELLEKKPEDPSEPTDPQSAA